MTRPPAACTVPPGLPGCDTGPAGRLGFVLREARAAWRNYRSRTANPTNDDRHSAPTGADGRPDLPLGGTR